RFGLFQGLSQSIVARRAVACETGGLGHQVTARPRCAGLSTRAPARYLTDLDSLLAVCGYVSLTGLTGFRAEGRKSMAEPSPSQLITDWQTAAKNKDATTLEKYYADNAVLCATEGIISGKSSISGDFKTQFTN